jgi:hypothetical protein
MRVRSCALRYRFHFSDLSAVLSAVRFVYRYVIWKKGVILNDCTRVETWACRVHKIDWRFGINPDLKSTFTVPADYMDLFSPLKTISEAHLLPDPHRREGEQEVHTKTHREYSRACARRVDVSKNLHTFTHRDSPSSPSVSKSLIFQPKNPTLYQKHS